MTSRDSASSDITPEVLLRAYACGIFPMAESADDPTLFWVEPEMRGNPEAIERYDAAHFGLDPEQRRVIGAFGHREDAAGIGAQQHFGRDFGRGGVARGHRLRE